MEPTFHIEHDICCHFTVMFTKCNVLWCEYALKSFMLWLNNNQLFKMLLFHCSWDDSIFIIIIIIVIMLWAGTIWMPTSVYQSISTAAEKWIINARGQRRITRLCCKKGNSNSNQHLLQGMQKSTTQYKES